MQSIIIKYMNQNRQVKTSRDSNSPRKYHNSVSLPKIHMQSDSENNISIQKDIHSKVYKYKKKYRIPNCTIETHQFNQIIYMCVHPKCKESSRLLCETCFYQNHSMHNQNLLALDQIRQGEIHKIRFWPFQKKFKNIYDYINKHETYVNSLINDINVVFKEMSTNIMNEIKSLKQELLSEVNRFYNEQTTKKNFVEEMKVELQQSFELKKIKSVLERYFQRELKYPVFCQEIDKIFTDEKSYKLRERAYQHFINTEKGKDMNFDKKRYKKKENEILQKIYSQKVFLKKQGTIAQIKQISLEQLIPKSLDYILKLTKDDLPATFIRQIYQDQTQYVGFINLVKQKCIFGRKSYRNSDIYIGEWKQNKRCGWGQLINQKNKQKYQGQWKQDKKWGYGKQQSQNNLYFGEFVNGKRNGFGILLQNGRRIESTWKNDKKHGSSKIIESNGKQILTYYLHDVEAPLNSKKFDLGDIKEISKKYKKQI